MDTTQWTTKPEHHNLTLQEARQLAYLTANYTRGGGITELYQISIVPISFMSIRDMSCWETIFYLKRHLINYAKLPLLPDKQYTP